LACFFVLDVSDFEEIAVLPFIDKVDRNKFLYKMALEVVAEPSSRTV
jgi:hypothetical protein